MGRALRQVDTCSVCGAIKNEQRHTLRLMSDRKRENRELLQRQIVYVLKQNDHWYAERLNRAVHGANGCWQK